MNEIQAMSDVQLWIMLISAITAAVVSIINAWRGNKIEQKLAAMNHLLITKGLPNVIPGTLPGSPGITLGNALRFWDLLSSIIAAWSGIRGLKVGQTAPFPEIKAKIDGHHWRFFGGQVQKVD